MFLLGSLVDLWVRIPLLIWSFYVQWFWLCDKLVILFVFSQYNLIWGERINSITEFSSFISWVIECVMRLCYPVWISVTIHVQNWHKIHWFIWVIYPTYWVKKGFSNIWLICIKPSVNIPNYLLHSSAAWPVQLQLELW